MTVVADAVVVRFAVAGNSDKRQVLTFLTRLGVRFFWLTQCARQQLRYRGGDAFYARYGGVLRALFEITFAAARATGDNYLDARRTGSCERRLLCT